MKIRNKLILILTLFSIVPVLTLGFIGIYNGQKALEKQIGDSSLELARMSVKRINEYLYEKLKDSQSWTYNVKTEDIISNDSNNNVSRYFTRLAENYDHYYYINCLNNKGKVIASSNADLIESDLSANAGFRDALNGNPSIQDVSFDEVAGDYSVVMFIPVTDRTEQTVIGVFKVALIWSKVIDMITNIKIGDKEQTEANHIMLTNEDGMVIFCIDPNEMFTTNLIDIGMKAAKYAQEHKEGYLIETTEHGSNVFVTYTYSKVYKDLPHLHWILVLEQDPETVFAVVGSLKKIMIFTLSGTVAFLIIISFLFANRISKPILAVVAAAKAIGKGNMNTKVSVKSNDEIGQLADSFNKMIIDLKEFRDNLEQSEERYRSLIEDSSEIIYQTDKKRFFAGVNKTMLNKLGFPSEELLGMRMDNIVPDNEREKIIKHTREVIENGVDSIETQFLTKEGKVIHVEINSTAMYDSESNFIQARTYVHDITERKKAEEKLNIYQGRLKSLASELSSTEERERRHIAEELHDHIGQTLAVIKMKIQALRKLESSIKYNGVLDEAQELLEKTIHDTRSLTFELSPPALYEVGFEPAVERLTEQYQESHGIVVDFVNDGKPKPLGNDIRILLFKAVRELLANVVKHARAHKTKVSLVRGENDNIRIEVEDDGIGFNVPEFRYLGSKTGGFGLFNMRERLEHLGGHLEIMSEPGRGSRFTLTAPLKCEKETIV
jgi:PAS domain S-box-containing protein